MSVSQLIRRTGRFEEVRPHWGTTVGFFLGRKRHGGSIFVQANDEAFHIWPSERQLRRFPNSNRLRAFLEAHAYWIGDPDCETERYFVLGGEDQIGTVLRISRDRCR